MTPTLVPMTEAEFSAYADEAVPAYAAEKVAAGQWAPDEALALSRRSLAELLPQGLRTPDHHLYTVRDGEGVAVGVLWMAVQARAGVRIAYVYDVAIRAGHRRRGHAQRAFAALEEEARALGLGGVALHVFGHNTAAQALYAALGYRPTNINLYKPLAPAGG